MIRKASRALAELAADASSLIGYVHGLLTGMSEAGRSEGHEPICGTAAASRAGQYESRQLDRIRTCPSLADEEDHNVNMRQDERVLYKRTVRYLTVHS
jgi:hypothetical protein